MIPRHICIRISIGFDKSSPTNDTLTSQKFPYWDGYLRDAMPRHGWRDSHVHSSTELHSFTTTSLVPPLSHAALQPVIRAQAHLCEPALAAPKLHHGDSNALDEHAA